MTNTVTLERKNGTQYHVVLRNYGYSLKVGGSVPGMKGKIVAIKPNF